VFLARDSNFGPTTCSVQYTITPQANRLFTASVKITNTGSQPVNNFSLRFELAQGQAIQGVVQANAVQSGGSSNGRDVTISPAAFQQHDIPPGGSFTPAFAATYDGLVNQIPPNFKLNGKRCSSNH